MQSSIKNYDEHGKKQQKILLYSTALKVHNTNCTQKYVIQIEQNLKITCTASLTR